MTIVRACTIFTVLSVLISGPLGPTAPLAAAQAWPVQRFTLNGMWADVTTAPPGAGGGLFILVDLVPQDSGLPLQDRRVTVDLAPLGLQRTIDLYDEPGDGSPALVFFHSLSVDRPTGDLVLHFTASADLGRGGTFDLPVHIQPPSPTVTGNASPNTLVAGGDTLLTAAVTPGGNPPSTGLGVSAATSAIGIAGNTELLDNGTAGDATAGDNVFSRSVTVAPGTSAGAKFLPVTVTDAQGRSGSGTIALTVQMQAQPPTPPTVTASFLSPSPLGRYVGARVVVSVTSGANPASTGLQVKMNLSAFGGSPATALSDAGGGSCDATAGDLSFAACFHVPATMPIGALTVTGQVSDAQGRTAPVSISTSVSADADTDADGLPDQCEATFGLSTSSGVGENGASGDPDGDGLSNAQECTAGTHPRGAFRRYLAEGVTNDFFQTRIALFNPSATPTTALVRIQPEGAPERSLLVTVPGQQRRTLTPEDTAAITGAPFATVVESDVEVVVDRLMTWGVGAYGSHAETAVHAPSSTWYLAEGATGWRFSLFYLLQNPSDTAADVEISYLRGPSDPVLVRTYTVPARQRRTIWVDEEQFPEGSGVKPLGGTDVSASIRSANDVPIIVERSMYMSPDDQVFGAGHAAAGVTATAANWFFAEGATGTFFDEYIFMANPGDTTASVTITYSPEGGAPVIRAYDVAPHSRKTIWVDLEPGLQNAALSASVSSTVPIVAERAMWWPGTGDSWRESHVSSGATSTGPRWAIADVELGGPFAADTYLLVYNGGTVTLYFDDGSAAANCGSAGAGRVTMRLNDCAGVGGKRFASAIVNGNSQTVVERVTYFSAGGLFSAGGAAMATPIP